MTPITPSPKRRKLRMLRPDGPPDDLVVVIRAAPGTEREAVDDLTTDALASGRAYAIEARPGDREPLFGVSVFARPPGVEMAEILARFDDAPAYLEANVSALRDEGFTVWPTGTAPDHFDVQLLPGAAEYDSAPAYAVVARRRGSSPSPAGYGRTRRTLGSKAVDSRNDDDRTIR